MRLTLRTLLAYLDDTLEPAQAKIIGQKVAESEQARELMDHIKQVTRRRRITTPPPNGPGGKIDPNTIAEYLDGAVSAEQAGEVEQVCLASDAHLAEMAACHQILALVLGEPALVPPTAKSRMYSLVKGPESIPFRKPTNVLPSGEEDHAYSGDELDETMRMGTSLGLSKWTSLFVLIGSGIGASILLFFAIWHVLDLPGENDNKGALVARGQPGDPIKEPPSPQPQPKNLPIPEKQKTKENKGTGDPKKDVKNDTEKIVPKEIKNKGKPEEPWFDIDPPKTPVVIRPIKEKDAEGDLMPANRFTAADNRSRKLGVYLMPSAKDPGLVLRRQIGKPMSAWNRLWGDKIDVESGCTYVVPQGFRGDMLLEKKLQLTQVGMMPIILRTPYPVNESVVDLHSHDSFIDMTLRRGRVVLTSQREGPVAVRIRFENPNSPQQPEFADIVLQGNGTQIFVDHVSVPPMDAPFPFVKDPESDKRVLPVVTVYFCVAKGKATIRLKDTYTVAAPPGHAALVWTSIAVKGKNVEPAELPSLPEFVSLTPPAPPKELKKISDDFLKARADLSAELGGKPIDVRLAESLTSKDPIRRILVVLTYAALDMLDDLIEVLKNERHADLGDTVVQSLRNCLTNSRDSEFVLYARIKEHFPPEKTADKIMELLHGIGDLELLIDYLDNSSPVIRRISYLDLMRLNIPMAQTIQYDPLMPDAARMAAQTQWRALLNKLKKKEAPKK